ncbi:F0F1 ATP synthase subunit B [Tessaracoccus lapidicaptus]|uniref:ATP synthase subunit b n=1 Tax=Tessaracoccus lapidicaptus TaxID=1427523 RepID=A0A1C0AN94_9ACTN|nr:MULTISPECIES: F0F1 ATP synthase subunit B [Tessaracoccus]AQX14730.1 F0F1 ATP synthase subunit B [Tessaracoccus sp. T2.5-30]OCL34610.1 F0F1 ATP synthase subunit B [Tessaracoccus lapidicaptus]VEP38809.1 ATP synthase subunit b [Tessaracoccus lapidicaptus]
MFPFTGALLEIDLGPLMPHYLSEIIAGILLMLVIFLLMWKVVVPAFEKMYEERTNKIEGGMRRAAAAEAKAAAALAEYNDQLSAAREEAARIREDAKNQSAALVAEAREKAAKESQRILDAGRQQLEAERSQLVHDLRGEVGGIATTLAGKIVGESLTDDERAMRTVDRFLAELESAGQAR